MAEEMKIRMQGNVTRVRGGQEHVTLSAVPGAVEHEGLFRAHPQAHLSLVLDGPAGLGKLDPEKDYLVTITEL